MAVLNIAFLSVTTSYSAQLPDSPGKATMQKICSGCHAPEIVIGRHDTKQGWEQVVSSMVDKGANGTDDEFNTIIDYLAANFPKTTANEKGGNKETNAQPHQ
ncbi:MAG TPA: cytochrome c [Bryobacteraceae bacterium]|jgi:cytochrome c5|nr:cytochrome c [Bryobacteraceae bacterium]